MPPGVAVHHLTTAPKEPLAMSDVVQPFAPESAGEVPSLAPDLAAKYDRLRANVHGLGSVLVAYSGGVDSALLLKVAHDELGEHALGVLAISPAYDDDETAAALAVAAQMSIPVVTVATQEMDNPAYVANGVDRCFHCKDELFDRIAPIAAERGLAHIAYGVNRDDLGDYRPGQKAARQHGVCGPLLDAELGKAEIRALAQHLGVPVWNKPALACYSSRIPYGTTVTVEALRRIGKAERVVRDLGFSRVRVRHHDSIARIEVDPNDLPRIIAPEVRAVIDRELRALGYLYITLDLRGYRTGSLNDVLRRR
jgi:uncharacterized protein